MYVCQGKSTPYRTAFDLPMPPSVRFWVRFQILVVVVVVKKKNKNKSEQPDQQQQVRSQNKSEQVRTSQNK
jgi:hypothetical protein